MKKIIVLMMAAAIVFGTTSCTKDKPQKCSPENTEKMLNLVQDMLESSVKEGGFLLKTIISTMESGKASDLKEKITSSERKSILESGKQTAQKLMEFANSHPECDLRNYREMTDIRKDVAK